MTLRMHYRLTTWGFALVYLSAMGAVMINQMPLFQTVRVPTLWFLLVTGSVGVVIIVIEKILTPEAPPETGRDRPERG